MPARKTYARKPRAKKVYRKKRMVKSRTVMVNAMPRRVHNIVAPIFFTTMQCQVQVRLPVGALATDTFAVYASKLYEPFNSTLPLGGITTSLGTIATNNLLPAGFTALSNLYECYRVHKCQMRLTVTPRLSADYLLLVALPQDEDTTVAATAQQALSSPYSKTITCTGNNNIKQNTLHLGIKNRTYFGRTKQSYRSENDYAAVGGITSPPLINMLYHVWYQTYSGAVTTADTAINLVLNYSVEFFEPKTDLAV